MLTSPPSACHLRAASRKVVSSSFSSSIRVMVMHMLLFDTFRQPARPIVSLPPQHAEGSADLPEDLNALTKSGPAKLCGQFAGRRTVFDAKRSVRWTRYQEDPSRPHAEERRRGAGPRLSGHPDQLVLSLDPAADLNRAQLVYDAHLARARWMTCRLSSLLK